MELRVGIGFDVHKFTFGHPLVLGGVKVPFSLGLEGHSDADVVLHAIIDALLGATSSDDIGTHFPDTDEQYKDISSLVLLKETGKIMEKKEYKIVNIDVVVMLEEPKISPLRSEMKKAIANELKIEPEQINIKATTTEGLGFIGQNEGAAAQAVALVEEI